MAEKSSGFLIYFHSWIFERERRELEVEVLRNTSKGVELDNVLKRQAILRNTFEMASQTGLTVEEIARLSGICRCDCETGTACKAREQLPDDDRQK